MWECDAFLWKKKVIMGVGGKGNRSQLQRG